MVVKAGVVVVHPADQPRGEVRVGEQLLVDALSVIVVDAWIHSSGRSASSATNACSSGRSGPGRAGGERRRAGVSSERLLPRDRDDWGSHGSGPSALAAGSGRPWPRARVLNLGYAAGRRRADGARGGVGEQTPSRAPPGSCRAARLDDGAVGPVQELTPGRRSPRRGRRSRAVRRRRCRRRRADRAPGRARAIGAAARGQALCVQRREAGEHREDDPQLGVLGTPGVQEREPGRVHVGHVVRERGPPERIAERARAGSGAAAAPGWTNNGAPSDASRASSGRRSA